MPTERHRPRKRFGQHFLAPAWADRLVKAIDPQSNQTFIEIGPGEAALTRPLAARAGTVVAIEIDRDLAAALRDAAIAGVTILEGDFLAIDEGVLRQTIGAGPIRVAANLPYNVASPILFRLAALARPLGLTDATVMLQREVADRLVASPGSRDYGVLTILLGRRAEAARLFTLPPGAFRPAPKVHSAVVRLRFHDPTPPAADERFLETLVQAAFTRRRKTLSNALRALVPDPGLIANTLKDMPLSGSRRPETLAIPEWVALADALCTRLHGRG